MSDITYIHTQEGFLFLAVVMDLYARNIVGWSMSHRMTDDLVLDALTMAYWRRRPKTVVKLHSDQGSQYNSRNFARLLKQLNIEPSMSRRGNCWDNAVAESFFSNLKKEKLDVNAIKTGMKRKLTSLITSKCFIIQNVGILTMAENRLMKPINFILRI